MRIKDLSNKVVQLEKDIKEIKDTLENIFDDSDWELRAKESYKHIVKVLYNEYLRLHKIYTMVCVTEVYSGPDDQVLPEVKRFFSEL